jgi:perosamine synthetase
MKKELDYVFDAVTNYWFDSAILYHDSFERAFADYFGVPYAVAIL